MPTAPAKSSARHFQHKPLKAASTHTHLVLVSVAQIPHHERKKKVQSVALVAISEHVDVQGRLPEAQADERIHCVYGHHPKDSNDFAL